MRAFQPQLSPYTTAVASGSIRVVGELANVDHLLVDATVERLDVRLFDYALRNARPIRLALDRHAVRVTDMRIVGQDTQLDVSGLVNLHDSRIAIRTTGDANLAVLQGFVADVRSSGMAALSATLEGPLEDPALSGTLDITDGRIRHFALPHALENISGTLQFDTRGVTLDGLTGRLARGDVTFGGRIDKQGYLPGQTRHHDDRHGHASQARRGDAVARGCPALAAGHDGGGDAVGSGHRERRRVHASVCVQRRAARSGDG